MRQPFDPANLSVGRLSPSNVQVEAWYAALKTKYTGHGAYPEPGIWMGLFDGNDLITAYGAHEQPDKSLVVTAAVCEPSRRGLVGLGTLGIMLRDMAAKHTTYFFVDSRNLRMKRIADYVLKAPVVAELRKIS